MLHTGPLSQRSDPPCDGIPVGWIYCNPLVIPTRRHGLSRDLASARSTVQLCAAFFSPFYILCRTELWAPLENTAEQACSAWRPGRFISRILMKELGFFVMLHAQTPRKHITHACMGSCSWRVLHVQLDSTSCSVTSAVFQLTAVETFRLNVVRLTFMEEIPEDLLYI